MIHLVKGKEHVSACALMLCLFFRSQFIFVFLRFMLPQWTEVTCGHVTCFTIGYVCGLFNWKVVFSIIVLVVVVGIAIISRSPVSKGTCPFWLKWFGYLDLQVTFRRHGRSKIAIDGTPMHLWPTHRCSGILGRAITLTGLCTRRGSGCGRSSTWMHMPFELVSTVTLGTRKQVRWMRGSVQYVQCAKQRKKR